jgi:hypothetical protein
LVAAGKKLGADKALAAYSGSKGRSHLQRELLGQQDKWLRDRFERQTGLIDYWRDQSAHGHETGFKEEDAYSALNALLRFAHFVADNWEMLTK